MSEITIWKKLLRCISVKDWQWEYVIAEMTCDSNKLLRFHAGKCRVPSVRLVHIYPTPYHPYHRQIAAWTRARASIAAAAATTADRWDVSKSWQYNYGNINYTNLKDGDIVSWYDHTKWVIGETIHCDTWDSNPEEQCSSGIHVFLTRQEAENYEF